MAATQMAYQIVTLGVFIFLLLVWKSNTYLNLGLKMLFLGMSLWALVLVIKT